MFPANEVGVGYLGMTAELREGAPPLDGNDPRCADDPAAEYLIQGSGVGGIRRGPPGA
ncbi:hypothetical protein [Streptomyces sp. N2A]|uniref:hypothetical protein n=1 Tax=Streptomyces sp. N2A TaxID=3073936 RepID=UPI00286FD3C5|nr:hypothetical protein [Streptomyces sp. N2A]